MNEPIRSRENRTSRLVWNYVKHGSRIKRELDCNFFPRRFPSVLEFHYAKLGLERRAILRKCNYWWKTSSNSRTKLWDLFFLFFSPLNDHRKIFQLDRFYQRDNLWKEDIDWDSFRSADRIEIRNVDQIRVFFTNRGRIKFDLVRFE